MMNRVLTLSFLVFFVPQLSSAEPVYEIGSYKVQPNGDGKLVDHAGSIFIQGSVWHPGSMDFNLKCCPWNKDIKRLFYVDRSGFSVIGEDLPEHIAPYQPTYGDLVVTNRLFAQDVIWSDGIKLQRANTKLQENVSELKANVSELKTLVAQLMARLEKLEEAQKTNK